MMIVWTSKKHLTQSERYLPPVDDLVSDEKVQAKFYAEKKRDRVRKTKIKQDKIINDMRCEFVLVGVSASSVYQYALLLALLTSQGPHYIDNNETSAKVTTKYGRR